jgi:type II secretory ATPase GspE/PulE/Tfp pilus assembly ATPase PilB-like protein
LYEPVGCPACGGTGYHGQTAVIEVLTMSDSIRRLVLGHAEAREIQRVAVEEGMRTMYEDGRGRRRRPGRKQHDIDRLGPLDTQSRLLPHAADCFDMFPS